MKHPMPPKLFCRSLVCAIGLSSATVAFAQKTDTTQDIENFFTQRADTLQKHLSVPLSDQAFHKRFIEAYQPLNEGKIPSQWRDALVQRILALAGVDASQLSAAQQAQVANSLNVLGNASATSEQSAAALAALGGALGISNEAASSALAGAAGDTSLFNGNTATSQNFLNNNQAGINALINQGSNPNTLAVAQILPPADMKFDNEGAAIGIVASKLPNPQTLTMGNYAEQMGKPPGSSTSPSSAGNVAANKAKTSHPDSIQTILAQGLGETEKNFKESKFSSPSVGSSSNFNDGANTGTSTGDGVHQGVPLVNGALKNQVPTVRRAESVVPTLATDKDPFKFDPQILLGGDYFDQYRRRVEAMSATGSAGSGVGSGASGAAASGASVSASKFKQGLIEMGDSCEKDLHEMYGFKQGQVPQNLSFEQITEMWRKHTKKKNEIRQRLYDLQEAEDKSTKTKTPEATTAGKPVLSLRSLIRANENTSLPEWNPIDPVATNEKGVDTEPLKTLLRESPTPAKAFNQVADDLLSTFAAHLNGLANTDQDACPLVGKLQGNPSKGECGKEFAISKDKDGTFRNSTLTNHLKMMSLLDSIRELNSTEAEAIHNVLKTSPEAYAKRFGDSRKGNSLTKIVLMRDDSTPAAETNPAAPPSAPAGPTAKATPAAQASAAEAAYRPRHRRSFNLQEYLYACANPETSWMAKIQDLEILARRSLIKSCPIAAQESAGRFSGIDYNDTNIPIYPATSDICLSARVELKTKFKSPADDAYPDFFNTKSQLTDSQCENLNKTHQSILQILKVGNYKCLEKLGKRPERTGGNNAVHSQPQP